MSWAKTERKLRKALGSRRYGGTPIQVGDRQVEVYGGVFPSFEPDEEQDDISVVVTLAPGETDTQGPSEPSEINYLVVIKAPEREALIQATDAIIGALKLFAIRFSYVAEGDKQGGDDLWTVGIITNVPN